MTDRDKLNVALGDKDVHTISQKITGTFLDHLPKDVIQYLHQYTGPIDCFYLTNIIHNNQNRRVPQFHAWVNKTQTEATNQARNKGYLNNQLTAAKIIFIDGQPHLTQPIDRTKLYGMPRPPRKKRKAGSLSGRCTGTCINGKRCKNRTSKSKGKCSTHSTQ